MTDRTAAIPSVTVPSSFAASATAGAVSDPELRHLLPAILQAQFDELIAVDVSFRDAMFRIQDSRSKAVVFGGWVRDAVVKLVHGQGPTPRDLDFVLDGATLEDVVPANAVRNVFGGYGFRTDVALVDIWSLPNTYLIAKRGLPSTFESLPLTADFRCNAIIYLPAQFFGTPQVLECGAIESIRARVIDFGASELPIPEVQAARVIIYAAKLGFVLSPPVQDLVRAVCHGEARKVEVLNGIRKHCPPALLRQCESILHALTTEKN